MQVELATNFWKISLPQSPGPRPSSQAARDNPPGQDLHVGSFTIFKCSFEKALKNTVQALWTENVEEKKSKLYSKKYSFLWTIPAKCHYSLSLDSNTTSALADTQYHLLFFYLWASRPIFLRAVVQVCEVYLCHHPLLPTWPRRWAPASTQMYTTKEGRQHPAVEKLPNPKGLLDYSQQEMQSSSTSQLPETLILLHQKIIH